MTPSKQSQPKPTQKPLPTPNHTKPSATASTITPTASTIANTKTDRLDRLEKKLALIEHGLLILINQTRWHNESINPGGYHEPATKIEFYENLKDAVYYELDEMEIEDNS